MTMQAQAVLYGIGSGLETRPNYLEQQHWRLIANIAKGKPEEVCLRMHISYDMHTMIQVQVFDTESFCRERSLLKRT